MFIRVDFPTARRADQGGQLARRRPPGQGPAAPAPRCPPRGRSAPAGRTRSARRAVVPVCSDTEAHKIELVSSEPAIASPIIRLPAGSRTRRAVVLSRSPSLSATAATTASPPAAARTRHVRRERDTRDGTGEHRQVDRRRDHPGQHHTRTPAATAAAITAGSTSSTTTRVRCRSPRPMVASRASVISRSAAPSASSSSITASPSTAGGDRRARTGRRCRAAAAPWLRPFKMSERSVVTPPQGAWSRTTAASRAESMFAPVSSSSLTGTGRGLAPWSAESGMITKAPPPGSAGVADSTPATRTRTRLDGAASGW